MNQIKVKSEAETKLDGIEAVFRRLCATRIQGRQLLNDPCVTSADLENVLATLEINIPIARDMLAGRYSDAVLDAIENGKQS
jgi:hypothetical protein